MNDDIKNAINEITDDELREALLKIFESISNAIINMEYYVIFKDYIYSSNVYELHRLKRVLYRMYSDSDKCYVIYKMIEKVEDVILKIQTDIDKINASHNERLKHRKSI